MNMQIDRVVVINDRSHARGGATALALLSARLLAERGVPVTYIAGDDGEGFAALRSLGIECEAIGGRALVERGRVGAFVEGLYNARARSALSRWIMRHDTPRTVYHLHGWSKILSPAVFGALAVVRDRTVLHAHDYFLACPNGGFTNYPQGLVCEHTPMSRSCLTTQCDKRGGTQKAWRVARHALRARMLDVCAMDVLLIHPAMRKSFERSGFSPERLHAVRNPVTPFCPPGSLDPVAQDAIVFVGRLENEKGYMDAANAAQAVGVPIEFVGEGPGRDWLAQEHPNVPVHGWLDRAAMAPILARARAVVMPSRWPEPFGLVAVEALTSGLPIILPDKAALADEVADFGVGLVYETANADALARAISFTKSDDTVRCMSEAALRHGPAMANTETGWCEALLDRYTEITERSHPRVPSEASRVAA